MPPNSTPYTLKQRHILFGSREFTLQSAKLLRVRERSLFRRSETVIPLVLLQTPPSQASSFAIKWLFNGLFSLVLGLLLFFWGMHSSFHWVYVPAVILVGTAGVMLYRFFLYTTHLTIFHHSHTHANFLYLWRNKPNQAAFEQFLKVLIKHIEAQHTTNP